MALNIQDSRILIKGSTVASTTPTAAPSNDFTDGTWIDTDIYTRELFANTINEKLWMRFSNSIKQIAVATNPTANRLTYWNASGHVDNVAAPVDGQFLKYTTANGYEWAAGGGGGYNEKWEDFPLNIYLNGADGDDLTFGSELYNRSKSNVNGNTCVLNLNLGFTIDNNLADGVLVWFKIDLSFLVGISGKEVADYNNVSGAIIKVLNEAGSGYNNNNVIFESRGNMLLITPNFYEPATTGFIDEDEGGFPLLKPSGSTETNSIYIRGQITLELFDL
jgi:hypothetical protein